MTRYGLPLAILGALTSSCGGTDPAEACRNVNLVCGEATDCSAASSDGASEAELQCKLTAPNCEFARACNNVTQAEQTGAQ